MRIWIDWDRRLTGRGVFVWMLLLSLLLGVLPTIRADDPPTEYPTLKGICSMKSEDIEPYRVSSDALKEIVARLKTNPCEETYVAFVNLLCRYAELPSDYETILAQFRRNGIDQISFSVQVGENREYDITVSEETRIITSRGILTSEQNDKRPPLLTQKNLTDKQIAALFLNFCKLEHTSLEGQSLWFACFGKQTTVIKSFFSVLPTTLTNTWLADKRNGDILLRHPYHVMHICRGEFPRLTSPEKEFPTFFKSFARLWHDENVVLISGTTDIPKYDSCALDDDIEPAVRPFFVSENAKEPGKKNTYAIVAYGYQKIGGVVYRYRFVFDENGELCSYPRCAEVGRNIGDAQYYD